LLFLQSSEHLSHLWLYRWISLLFFQNSFLDGRNSVCFILAIGDIWFSWYNLEEVLFATGETGESYREALGGLVEKVSFCVSSVSDVSVSVRFQRFNYVPILLKYHITNK